MSAMDLFVLSMLTAEHKIQPLSVKEALALSLQLRGWLASLKIPVFAPDVAEQFRGKPDRRLRQLINAYCLVLAARPDVAAAIGVPGDLLPRMQGIELDISQAVSLAQSLLQAVRDHRLILNYQLWTSIQSVLTTGNALGSGTSDPPTTEPQQAEAAAQLMSLNQEYDTVKGQRQGRQRSLDRAAKDLKDELAEVERSQDRESTAARLLRLAQEQGLLPGRKG